MPPSTYRGMLYALLGAFLSACFLIPWKLATRYGSAADATLVLLAAAAVFNSLASAFSGIAPALRGGAMAMPALRTARTKPRSLALTLQLAAAFAVLSLAGNLSSAEAVHRISGALLSVMQRCEVLVVGLLGSFVLRERVRPGFWIGTLLAGGGLLLLAQPAGGQPATPAQGAELSGALFGLGSALCFGAMAVLTRRHIQAIDPVLVNALRLWLGVLLWFVVERRVPALRPELVLHATLAALFGPFLSRLAVMFSAFHVAASTTALASLITPVLTLLLAFFVLGALPTARELLGGAVMLAGVAIPVLELLREDRARRERARA